MTARTKAERAADEASAEVRRLQAEDPIRPAALRAAIRRRDRAWRVVNQLRVTGARPEQEEAEMGQAGMEYGCVACGHRWTILHSARFVAQCPACGHGPIVSPPPARPSPDKESESVRALAGDCAELLEALEIRGGSVQDLCIRLGWYDDRVRRTLEQIKRDLRGGRTVLRHSGVMGTWWLERRS